MDVNILVVEDDHYIKMVLDVVLTLCDFKATIVENCRIALDELLKESSNFEVVLIDYKLSEEDGFDLLTHMKDHERLKGIPLFMMGYENEQENIQKCLSKGATDYFTKPIRIKSIKTLSQFVILNREKQMDDNLQDLKGLRKFTQIQILGEGERGQVFLVKSREGGDKFAMRSLSMKHMTMYKVKMVQEEVSTCIRELVFPSIIRCYESFYENENLYLITEFAEFGHLNGLICKHQIYGTRIDEETILYLTAQMVISLLFIHSKKILHRSIHLHHLFLTKENIVKLGEFCISSYDPSYIDYCYPIYRDIREDSPEVLNGQPYGEKSEIWALGRVVYSLANLRSPFESDNLTVLFKKIQMEEPEFIDNVGLEIRALISQMLLKNRRLRPSAWDLSQIPIVRENIRKYCLSEAPNNQFLLDILNGKNNFSSSSPPSQIELTFMNLRESLQPYDQKISLFQVEKSVINSEMIFKQLSIQFPSCTIEELEQKLEELIQAKKIHHIYSSKKKNDLLFSLYRFQFDEPGIPANHYKICTNTHRCGIDILYECIKLANIVIAEIFNKFNGVVDENYLINSKNYFKFWESVCDLQEVSLHRLQSQNESKCFFVNLIQVMQFHKFLHDKYMAKRKTKKQNFRTIFENLVSQLPFINKNETQFKYQIGKYILSLDDLKHGILRGNKSHRFSKFKPFKDDDERSQLVLPKLDLRLLFLFREENVLPHGLVFIEIITMENQLNNIAENFFRYNILIDTDGNSVTLHRLFQIYKEDFGKNPKEILILASKHTKLAVNVQELATRIDQGNTKVQFSDKFDSFLI